VLLIFYFCIKNEVQNPHVSVLKIIFCRVLFVVIKLGLGIKHWLKKISETETGLGSEILHYFQVIYF
jgi:hypothetical protein